MSLRLIGRLSAMDLSARKHLAQTDGGIRDPTAQKEPRGRQHPVYVYINTMEVNAMFSLLFIHVKSRYAWHVFGGSKEQVDYGIETKSACLVDGARLG